MMFFIYLFFFATKFLDSFRLDPDYGWHIFLGKNIVDRQSLITNAIGLNHYKEMQLHDHEWLSDILLYLIDRHLGYIFLVIIWLIIYLLIIRLSQKTARIMGKGNLNSISITTIITMSGLLVYQGIRLQILIVLAAVLLYYIWNSISSSRKRFLYYFLIFAIGNNLHGGMIMLLPIPLLLEFKKDNLKASIILLPILIIAILCNPLGIHYFELMIDYTRNDYYISHITEWRPLFSIPIRLLNYILPLAFFLFILIVNNYWRKIPKKELLLLSIYLFLGLRYIRFFPLFMVISAPYVAQSTKDLFSLVKNDRFSKIFYLMVLGFVALLISSEFITAPQKTDTWSDPDYPKNAMNFIKDHQYKGNFFNPYDWGGYIKGAHQEIDVFIDGRGPQAMATENKTILEVYYDFFSEDKTVIEKNLESHQISYVLIQKPANQKLSFFDIRVLKILKTKKEVFTSPKNNLMVFLANNPKWTKTYEDNLSEIYIKN